MRIPGRQSLAGLLAAAGLAVAGCSSAEDPPPPVWPSRQERGHIHVLRLAGSPYEMGHQHGRLMAAELAEGVEWLETDPMFSLMLALAEDLDLIVDAEENSFDDVLAECQGIADGTLAAGVAGLTVEDCVALAYADVIVENIEQELSGACTQVVATGAATPDGTLIHARNMDNAYLSYLIDHPTIIVRQPTGRIPYLEVGFPGSVSPHSGMNAAGIAIASNENHALDDVNRTGRSHIQMSRQVLQDCESIDEAAALFGTLEHASAESLMVSDGPQRQAAVFEMTAHHLGQRPLDEHGVVYLTNHFVHPEMAPLHTPTEPDASTRSRFARLEQLVPPEGEDTLYGSFDVTGAIAVLRDSFNPITGETHEPDLFDGGGTIANNAALHSLVFVPERLEVYVALGEPPVPQRTFIGFSLSALLATDGLGETAPAVYP